MARSQIRKSWRRTWRGQQDASAGGGVVRPGAAAGVLRPVRQWRLAAVGGATVGVGGGCVGT